MYPATCSCDLCIPIKKRLACAAEARRKSGSFLAGKGRNAVEVDQASTVSIFSCITVTERPDGPLSSDSACSTISALRSPISVLPAPLPSDAAK